MRRFVAAALLLLSATLSPALAVPDTNLPGSDYDNFAAGSPGLCMHTCGGESRCRAWTWVKPGIQGAEGRCWLKHSLPEIVRDSCCDSGPGHFIERRNMNAEDKTNRPGLDYKHFVSDSWSSCETACNGEGQCKSWTYVRRGPGRPDGHCWLKNKVARPVFDATTVSGVKWQPRSVNFD